MKTTVIRIACLAAVALAAGTTVSAQDRYYFHRPIIRVAQPYTLPAGETIHELQAVLGDVTIDGRVEQDVVVTMGNARIGPSAVIEGTLAVIGGSATIAQGASIRRDLFIAGGTLNAPETFSAEGYQVIVGSAWLGSALDDIAPWLTRGLLWGRLIVPDISWVWAVVGVFFLLYLALNTVFDRAVGACADALGTRPLSMFMAGMLVLLLAVPVIAIVAATVIGLVLVPFILCALIAAALVGKAAVARAIGRGLIRSEAPETRVRSTAAFVIGFALLTLAYMVPLLGFVTWALTAVLGFGAATVTFRAMLRRERPAPVAAPVVPPMQPPMQAAAGPAHVPAMAMATAPGGFATPPSMPASMPIDAPAPPPAYTQGLAQYPRASFLDRVAAFALDAVLVAIGAAMLDMDRYEGAYLLALLGYHIAFWAWRGTTLGGIICSLRVVRTHGAELRPADAIVRGLASVFSLAALGIGCLWMLQDSERQMWHDKIAGTLVVKVPRELVLT